MKVIYVGADHRQGTSKKTGKSYNMARLYYAIPAESKSTSDYVYQAHGYRLVEVDLLPEALPQFASCKPFTQVDVALEPVPSNPSRNQVTGIL